MRAIFINDARRMWQQKQLVFLLILFTVVAAVAAIFVSTSLKQVYDVAVVMESGVTSDVIYQSGEGESEGVNFIEPATDPSYSDLVSGKYDAIFTVRSDGSYEVESIKSDEATAQMLAVIEGQQVEAEQYSDRGIGTNVVGFLMVFILMMGSMAMSMFADDKQFGQIARVAASPIGIGRYLLGHCVFNLVYLFVPTMVILVVVQLVSGVDIGYTWGELAVLLALICAFSTAFSLLLYSFLSNKDESAKMTGNIIIILTSILAGGFFAFDKGNAALEALITVLPQKSYLTVANGIEQHLAWGDYFLSLLYLLGITIVFFALSAWKTHRDYVNK